MIKFTSARGVHEGCGYQHMGPDVDRFDRAGVPCENRRYRLRDPRNGKDTYVETRDSYFGLVYVSGDDVILPEERDSLLVEIK